MLAAAEERDMKVIVPNNDNFKGGFERKLYVASSLLWLKREQILGKIDNFSLTFFYAQNSSTYQLVDHFK